MIGQARPVIVSLSASRGLLEAFEMAKPILILTGAILPVLIALPNGLIFALGANATLAINLWGSFVIYAGIRPGWREYAVTLALAAILRSAYTASGSSIGPYFGAAWISWGSFLGLASLIMLGLRAARERDTAQGNAAQHFWAACIFLHGWILLVYALHSTPATLPETLDRFLYAFDASLGFAPSFLCGRILADHPLLWKCTIVQYDALMLAIAIVFAWQRKRPAPGAPRILPVFVTMLLLGFGIYHLCPAAGPGYAFPEQFPRVAPEKFDIPLKPLPLPTAARNAMPSLHMAAALLVWWHSRGSGWRRLAAALFLLATAFSTMALGEHYLVDLVVAFPFILAVQAGWSSAVPLRARVRYVPLVAGASMTLIWLGLVHYEVRAMLVLPALPWLLIADTILATLLLERRLARALPDVSCP